MPENKNQHYVPQAYLRPFSSKKDGKSIHLYHAATKSFKVNASIKGQCSKNYFYGRHDPIDDYLKYYENSYGVLASKISRGENLNDADFKVLREFWHLQFHRTKHAIEQGVLASHMLDEAIFRGNRPPHINPDSFESVLLNSIENAIKLQDETADLHPVLVENESDLAFITSDDPAILTNRLNLQKYKVNRFGLSTSGAVLILPISPRYLVLYYDRQIYQIRSLSHRRLRISTRRDIAALNCHQYLNCQSVFFCSDTNNQDEHKQNFIEIERLKTDRHVLEKRIVREDSPLGRRIYRLATDEEFFAARHSLIGLVGQFPNPKVWPSFLNFRPDGFGFTDLSSNLLARRKDKLGRSAAKIRATRFRPDFKLDVEERRYLR